MVLWRFLAMIVCQNRTIVFSTGSYLQVKVIKKLVRIDLAVVKAGKRPLSSRLYCLFIPFVGSLVLWFGEEKLNFGPFPRIVDRLSPYYY